MSKLYYEQGSVDNLQVFVVLKFSDISGSGGLDAIFGNDDGDYDRFVALYNTNLMVSGTSGNSTFITIGDFPADANPIQTIKFCVLSIHCNNNGTSGCGNNKSYVYCNGKKLKTFTAGDVKGDTSFYIGSLYCAKYYAMKGEVGRFLVCGNRDVPMNDDEIKNVHAYLMAEWKINEKAAKQGPAAKKGDRGIAGKRGERGLIGEKGDRGIAGEKGERGLTGEK